jgi:hypothetical protein
MPTEKIDLGDSAIVEVDDRFRVFTIAVDPYVGSLGIDQRRSEPSLEGFARQANEASRIIEATESNAPMEGNDYRREEGGRRRDEECDRQRSDHVLSPNRFAAHNRMTDKLVHRGLH